jgi:RNA polymerase sigma-70 factor, ECF subfamily
MTGPVRRLMRRDPLADPGPLVERVHAYVAYRIGAGADADDVTGETFTRAVRYRDSYDSSKGAPVDWLIGIARRCIDDALSARRQEHHPPDTMASGDLEEDTVNRLALWGAVGRLGERDRELIALRYGADLSARQIGRQLDMATNAVEVALHRALGRLRPLLEEQADVPATPATTPASGRSHRRTPPAGGTRESPPRG